MNNGKVASSSSTKPRLCCEKSKALRSDDRWQIPRSRVRIGDAIRCRRSSWLLSYQEILFLFQFSWRKIGSNNRFLNWFWIVFPFSNESVLVSGSKMLHGLPNFKKLLSVGIILMFIGGFILTVSNSGTGVKVHPNGPMSKLQPPIYPQPGKSYSNPISRPGAIRLAIEH